MTETERALAEHRMWATDDGRVRYQRVLSWLSGLPWRLGIRLQTLGEPFVSKEFLEGAAWLSRQENVRFVELVSNASFTPTQLRKFVASARVDRLSLWATYHHGQIELVRFIAACGEAQRLGIHVVAHALVFPDTIDATRAMIRDCQREGIRTDVTLGLNSNVVYPGLGVVPAATTHLSVVPELYRDEAAIEAFRTAMTRWRGQPCSAGHDYFRVMENGDVYPCGAYGLLMQAKLGSALDDGFVPKLREETYGPCNGYTACFCKEDYFHLKIAREKLSFERSLGYYKQNSEASARLTLVKE